MKKLLGLFLLIAAMGHAQTASLIAHISSTEAESSPPTTSTVLTGASAANALFVITHVGVDVTDSAGHSYVKLLDVNGFDTHITVWGALGITVGSSVTITTTNNYSHVSSMILAYSNIASFDKVVTQTDTTQNPLQIGPLTPTNPNSVLIGIVEAVYNTTPVVTFTSSPSSPAWTMLDTGSRLYSSMATFTDFSLIEGSATTTTLQPTDNSFNGHVGAVLSFATAASPLPLTTSTTSLPPIMRTKAYPQTCIQVGGGAAPYTITSTGTALPTGLSFDGKCITGNATTSGTTSGIVFHIVDHAGTAINTVPLSITVTPFLTTLDLHHPAYGFVLFPGAKRQLGVYETDPGATGRVDFTIPEGAGFANLSCTTNCPGNVQVTITGAAGTCSVSGSVGSYSVTGGTNFHIVATSRDINEDGSHSSDSTPVHICKGDHLVDTQPSYNQAFFGQQKLVYAYALGQVDQAGTWSCTAPDSSSCDAALDAALPTGTGPGTKRHNRSVAFVAPSVVGRYKLTFTSLSSYDGSSASNYSWIYVGGALTATHTGTTQLPITADHTEFQACFSDPAFGSRNYTVKADGTGDFTHIWGLPIADVAHPRSGGFVGRVYNQDTTGSNPTQYRDWLILRTGGTRDLPVVICGVTDGAGHLPIQQAQGFTNGPGDLYAGTTFQGGLIETAPFIGSPTNGYDTSYGPDYVSITGIAMRDADAVAANNNDKIGVWGIGGRHLNIQGMNFANMRDGALLNNNTIYFGPRYTEFQSFIGNYFDQCGADPGYGDHCLYVQGMYPLIVGNHFGTLIPNASGSWIKNRGGGSIEAFNVFTGSAGYTNNWWGDMSNAAPYTNVEMVLGPVGDTNCDDSRYCGALAGGDLNILHIMANEEALAHDYFYGNIETSGNSAPFFSYSAQNSDECASDYSIPCTLGDDHTGGFMLWNNTFNNSGTFGQSNDVFYNNGYTLPGVYGWTRLTYQNNSFWTDGSQGAFFIDNSPQFQADFATNLFATGTISITSPIQPGNTGWGNQIGGGGTGTPNPIWSAYAPKDSYLSGVTSANFIFTPTVPYGADFRPTPGSPLIGAGTATLDPLMALLPVLWEPDPLNGFMVTRTSSISTIGARSLASSSTLTIATTSLPSGTVGTPYNFCPSASGGTTPYTWTRSGGLPAGITWSGTCYGGTPTTAGITSGMGLLVTDATTATAAGTFTIVVGGGPALSVITTAIPDGIVGVTYLFSFGATGGTGPYTWAKTAGTLPAGLVFNNSTGTIVGVPTVTGTTTGLVFQVTDSATATASSGALPLTIVPTPYRVKISGTIKLKGNTKLR